MDIVCQKNAENYDILGDYGYAKKIFIKCHKRLDYIFAYACMNIKCFDFLTF